MGRQITRASFKREITNPAAASGAWAAQRGGWRPARQARQAHRRASSSGAGPVPWDTAAPHARSPCEEAKQRGGSRKQVSHDEHQRKGGGKLRRRQGGSGITSRSSPSPRPGRQGGGPRWPGLRPSRAV